jgi:DNA-binding transcriptional MerR regulator
MLVSELAERADLPLATVKYYLREGLLAPGVVTGPRRSEYCEAHVRRLRVLRMLREVGGVPVQRLRQIVGAMDDPDLPVHDAMTVIADVISDDPGPRDVDAASRQIVDDVLRGVGWDSIRAESLDRRRLAELVALLNGPGPLGASPEVLRYYAEVADGIAGTEISLVDHSRDRAELLEDMVTGSVVYGQVFALLRQLGHEHHHARQVAPAPLPESTAR